jgi:hypothetical protein
MSQVSNTKTNAAVAGATTSATSSAGIYSALATASAAVDDTNTRTECISRRHLKDLFETPTGEHPTFHQLETVFQNAASATYNNTAYADIAHGGNCLITFPTAITLRTGEALRLQANINMKACTKGADGGGALALTTDRYFYSFWATIGGVNTQISPNYGYSLTQNSQSTSAVYLGRNSSFSDKIQASLIVDQKEAFSYVYFNKTAPNEIITNCSVRVKVESPGGTATANTITLKEYRLVALGCR